MSSQFDCLNLCRLCLMKDRVQVPIFEDAGEVNQIFLKIHACLPIKLSRDDKLPKKICDDCLCKVELFYQFWNTAVDSEKQLLQWLGMEEMEDKQQGYVTEVLDPNVMKHEGSSDNRLDGNVLQVGGHQNMDLNMINNISIITMPAANEQSFSTVPMGADGTVHIAGPSTSVVHNQAGVAHLQEVDVHHEDVDNIDDGCDNDNGLTVKGEIGEDDRSMEQTYVTLSCDEAGPSGLQQQKLSDISEIAIQQSTDGEHKTGYYLTQNGALSEQTIKVYSADSSSSTILIATSSQDLGVQNTINGEHLVVVSTAEMLQCCPFCGDAFVDDISFDYHLKTMHPSAKMTNQLDAPSMMLFACTVCGQAFTKEDAFIEHQTTNCNSVVVLNQQLSPQQQHQLHQHLQQQQQFQQHPQMHHLQFHLQQPEYQQLNFQHQEFQRHNLQQELQQQRELLQQRRKLEPEGLGDDNELQQQQKMYRCDKCNYATHHRHNLLSHQRRHTQNYKYQCERCGSGFYARNSYQEHALAVHGEGKAYKCSECQATFRYRQGLRLHSKLHLPDYVPPEKKHTCTICNKRFCRKQVLMVHMKTHGGNSAPNEFVCHICGKGVSSKTYLAVHTRKHTGEKPHVCDICGKGFISQNYLSVHRRTHTGERPHKCTHCSKSFTQRTTLVVHLRSHTGDRPYPCTFCSKCFASKTMLNSHLKTHAKQKAKALKEKNAKLLMQQQKALRLPQQGVVLAQNQQIGQLNQLQIIEGEIDANAVIMIPA